MFSILYYCSIIIVALVGSVNSKTISIFISIITIVLGGFSAAGIVVLISFLRFGIIGCVLF